MPKKPRRTLLAGVIPTYSAEYNEIDYEFSVNQYVTKENTVLDYALFTCARVRCDLVIIICRPEQIPYFKLRYGDAFLDLQYCKWSDIMDGRLGAGRPFPIYYISPAQKYKNVDTEAFNCFQVSNLFMRAVDETFSILSPTNFCFILPYAVVLPSLLTTDDSSRRLRAFQDNHDLQDENSKFQFVSDSGNPLPNSSHTFLYHSDIESIWNKLNSEFKDYKAKNRKRDELLSYRFEELIDEYKNKTRDFVVPSDSIFDLRTWNGYVQLMAKLELTKEMPEVYHSNFLSTRYINNLPNLTYHLTGPKMNDDPYTIKGLNVSRKNVEYLRWKRLRNKLRKDS